MFKFFKNDLKLNAKLANCILDARLLETKELCAILSIMDSRDRKTKCKLMEALGNDDYDYFNRVYKEKHFIKNVISDLIEDGLFNMTLKEFIEFLWNFEYPQRDICMKIIKNQEKILYQFNQIDKSQTQVKNALRNIASNFFYSKINIELDLDNGTFKFGSRSISNESYSTETSSLEKVESTYFKKSSKNVLLVFDVENINENKENEINWFIKKLDEISINYTEFHKIEEEEDEDITNLNETIINKLEKSDLVILLLDKHLNNHFDENSNEYSNKYRLLGRQMYLEYLNNGCENTRFFVFLIDNCTDHNYLWLKLDKYSGNDSKQLFELFLHQNLLS